MNEERTQNNELFGSVKRGIAIGLAFAALYSGYVSILFLLVGSEPFAKHNTSLLTVITTYIAGGIAGGAVVGALRPFSQSRLSAIGIGFIASVFVIFGFLVAAKGNPTTWNELDWETLIVVSAFFGIAGGNMFWKNPI